MKLHLKGTEGKVIKWIVDFLNKRTIQVKVGSEISNQYEVEHGTPQGLFADDGEREEFG